MNLDDADAIASWFVEFQSDSPFLDGMCNQDFHDFGVTIRKLIAVAKAAKKIPEMPSAAHRLRTPGWDELQKTLSEIL